MLSKGRTPAHVLPGRPEEWIFIRSKLDIHPVFGRQAHGLL
jgi:hypothetical protein